MTSRTSVGLFSSLLVIAASVCGLALSENPSSAPHRPSLAAQADTAATLTSLNSSTPDSNLMTDGLLICGPKDQPNDIALKADLRSLLAKNSLSEAFPLTDAPARDLPGIVKLEPERDVNAMGVVTGHCSATRIAPNWFLTAAHCIAEGYDRIVLKVGSEQLSSDQIRRVQADFAVCHGNFTGTSTQFANDVALVHISDETASGLEDVPVIAWGKTRTPFSISGFRSARVGGWGLLEHGGEFADFLQKEELSIRDIRPDNIHLISRQGSGPCIGDSGGPLIVEDDGRPVMMGVLSTLGRSRTGSICAGEYLASYINLETQRDWIRTTMAACDIDAALCRR